MDSKFLPDGFFFAELVLSGLWVVGAEQPTPYTQLLQLRDPKNDLIFNFNFDDKMKNLWTVWISRIIDEYYYTPETMSWENTH